MTDVDIVTTTYYGNADKLKTTLKTVVERTKFVNYHWYLWVNEPDDKIKQVVHDAMFEDDICFTDVIEPIYNDSNDGSFSYNNNQAAAEGDGKYILFLNDDTEPLHDSWLMGMKTILDTDDRVGAVGALLLYPNKTIQHCGVFFSHRTNNLPFHMHYKQPLDRVGDYVSKPRYYQAVTGACLLVRRKDFEQLGGFSTDYFYSFEDVDLCLRLKDELNRRCVYTPSARLIHYEGVSGTQPNLEQNVAAFRKNCTGKYFNDYEFYQQNPNHMIYRIKK